MDLKSKHLWPATEEFLRPGQVYTDKYGNEQHYRSTPDWVVAAMLADLRALEAECERLRAENDMLFTRAAKRLAMIKELQAEGKCLCQCDACKYCEQLLETSDDPTVER